MSSEDVPLKIVDVGNDQLCRVSSSRWGSDSDSGDDGCLENVIDL